MGKQSLTTTLHIIVKYREFEIHYQEVGGSWSFRLRCEKTFLMKALLS